MTGLQRLCLITCGVVFLLIVIGGTVRATGSGLGCEDHWPKCDGKWIPNTDKATLIEYSHRLTASVVGFLALGIVITAFRNYRRQPRILQPAVAVGALVVFQALLGAVVVVRDLPPEIVTVHLGTALSIVTVLLLLTVTTFALDKPLPVIDVTAGFKKLATAVLGLTFVLMLIGAYLAGSDYGLACNGWPLCNGQVVPDVGTTSILVLYVHRLVALALGIAMLALLWSAWQQREKAPFAFTLTVAAFAVFILQSLVGASNVWTKLADGASIGHLTVGTLLWMILVVLNIRIHNLQELLSKTSEPQSGINLAKAPR
jgi:heme A synthase